jgi:hypothetical protein
MFFFLLAALQTGAGPEPAGYEVRLEAWAQCAKALEKGLAGKLLPHDQIKKRLSKDCAIEEMRYQSAMMRFIMTDGDPREIAAPIAAKQTAETQEHIARITTANVERNFLAQDKPELAALDACYAKTIKTDPKLLGDICTVEQAKLKAANAKRLKAAGVDDVVARNITATSLRRIRQAFLNGVE